MCGRFGLSREQRELAGEFADLNPKFEIEDLQPRYNVAPTQPVLILHVDAGQVRARELRWGISLPAARDGRTRNLINVRAETALGSEWFRELLDRHRALVPASHFYEWRALPGRRRQPMLVGPADGEGLVFAGLLGRWTDEATGEIVPAVAILTTTPNALLSGIHNRMPVILPRSGWGRWLDPAADAGDVADLLGPCPDDTLSVRPISTLVNDVANEGAALIEPPSAVPDEDAQLRLPW
jgi:putative SOS response-associated peptidase YedK